jgi:hypothetical protein
LSGIIDISILSFSFFMSDVFEGIDVRDTAQTPHTTDTIAEEESSDLTQDEGQKQTSKMLVASTSRKKASSVSFSSDLEKEPQSAATADLVEKPENRRAKV